MSQQEKILVLGDYQTGKTTLAKHAILGRFPRRLVWDPTYAFGYGQREWRDFDHMFKTYGKATFLPGRGNLEAKFDRFCEYALQQSNAHTFIDEPAMVGTGRNLPQSFSDLHRLGHKRGVGVTIASHSVWDLPHVTQQTHHLFVFRITRIVDVNALRQLIPEAAVERIPKLPDYHFYYQDRTGGRFCTPIPLTKNPGAYAGSSQKASPADSSVPRQ